MTLLRDQTGELVALAREGHVAAFIDRAWQLPPADFADVLVALSSGERNLLMAQLPPALAAQAQAVLALDAPVHAATAGALMTSRMVVVNESDAIAFAVEAVRRQAAPIGDLTEIFVVDGARRLRGLLPITRLLLAPPDTLVRDVMTPHATQVLIADKAAWVAQLIRRYGLAAVPVVDRTGRLLGRVTADLVRADRVAGATDGLLHFGGVSALETVNANWSLAVRSRLPWLYANLVPAFGAAAVVFFFRGTLLRTVTLAVWLPVVAGVGGNAGTQALATAIRRLMLHPERAEHLRMRIAREAAIGTANGAAMGAVIALVAVLVGESWKLGLVVLLATTASLVLAGIAGAAMPSILRRTGRDPAFASPVFVTALMDVAGFALLLGLASRLLR